MRWMTQIHAILGMSVFLSGCGIGLFPKTSYETLHPEPYRNFWTKIGMTEEGRRADWVACQGRADGNATPEDRLTGETDDFAAMRRTHRRLVNCMGSKGYVYSVK